MTPDEIREWVGNAVDWMRAADRYMSSAAPDGSVYADDGGLADQCDDLIHRADPITRAVGEVCEWVQDPEWGTWSTGCGNEFEFNDGGPTENGQKFCGYCGKPITEATDE